MSSSRHLLLTVAIVFAIAGCATTPKPKVDKALAISATKDLVASTEDWADQATYTAKHQGGWQVVVSCNQCHHANGTAVGAEYVVIVDNGGKASYLFRLGQ